MSSARLDRSENGQSIFEVVFAMFITVFVGAIILTTLSSYSVATAAATTRSNAATVASAELQFEAVAHCGEVTGTETSSVAISIGKACGTSLGDSQSTKTYGVTGYLVKFTGSWIPTGGSPPGPGCGAYGTAIPYALLEQVVVSWHFGGIQEHQSFTSVQATPPDSLVYHSSGTGGIVIPGGGSVTSSNGEIVSHSGPCAWFPFLTPGVWTVSITGGSPQSASVSAGLTTVLAG